MKIGQPISTEGLFMQQCRTELILLKNLLSNYLLWVKIVNINP